jgi:hypothetical protein
VINERHVILSNGMLIPNIIFDLNVNINNVFKELNLKDFDITRDFMDLYFELRYDLYFEINDELVG